MVYVQSSIRTSTEFADYLDGATDCAIHGEIFDDCPHYLQGWINKFAELVRDEAPAIPFLPANFEAYQFEDLYADEGRDDFERGLMLGDEAGYLKGWFTAFAIAIVNDEISYGKLSYPIEPHQRNKPSELPLAAVASDYEF